MQNIEKSSFLIEDLKRIESLGDSCELGFVLRELGNDTGGLFRWASSSATSILDTMKKNLEGLYQFENIVPQQAGMVHDKASGIKWHSEMRSIRPETQWIFEDTDAVRLFKYNKEISKINYLRQKMYHRFTQAGTIFVIKSNAGINPNTLIEIRKELNRLSNGACTLLLEIQENKEKRGKLEQLSHDTMQGFVGFFAPYERAKEYDAPAWHSILSQAIKYSKTINENFDHPVSTIKMEQLVLPFPSGKAGEQHESLPYLGQGASVCLTQGNEWCRIINDDQFRMHTHGSGEKAAKLKWENIEVPCCYGGEMILKLAISESLPIRATLCVEEGSECQKETVQLKSQEKHFIRILLPAKKKLSVSLTLEPERTITPNDRAVVDIAPFQLFPTAL